MKKKRDNYEPVTCPCCTECYYDLDRDPSKTFCLYGGPFLGYFDIDNKTLTDREGNKL